ncbi:MAG TPA: response regulator [Aromatoleum sp.]|uniref:response regulator n=1 Tax=Aromatoleum sp. TaxID=2307007 RepID=UPI002B4673BE|nr:response regulator [Aromatoleum sp.]HJV24353.1 response regulator [Aromatoleum sp.]
MREQLAAGSSILVVDDQPQYQAVLKRLLGRKGYRVHTAGDGETALAVARSEHPDLVLLDVMMPGMSGYETCRRLKAEAADRYVPVIFISGEGDVGAKVEAFECGGVDYITKPFFDGEVLMRVATHLTVHALQRSLEKRVASRTAELAVANAQLQREITERRQAEDKFRGVLESAPEAMVIVNAQREIALVNSRAEEMFGYVREELLGQPVEMLVPERTRPVHMRAAGTYVAAPRTRAMGEDLALFGRRRDGREFPVAVSLSPLETPEGLLVISTIRDISARKEAEAALRELAAHRDAVREEERKRIAGEIHDELGSLLTALKMDVSLLRMELPTDNAAQERIGEMRELIERTIRMVRQVATQLRPAALNLGLVPALEWLVDDFRRRTGLDCSFEAETEIAMDDAQATAAFRIVQESLTNVTRHAEARNVHVTLNCSGDAMELTVADDGCGFDAAEVGGSAFGLFGIRERARNLGGRASVVSEPGRGTQVRIWLPLAGGER